MRVCPTCSRTYADDIQFCPLDGGRLKAVEVGTEAQLAAGLSRRFRIVRRLGAGGMGAVYLAEQISVGNRRVALKVLSRKLLDDPEFLERFHNEAASTGRIDDPNVVTIYESGQADDGTPYIAMKYLEGETLRQALRERGALPLAECAEILQQVARGLDAAHKLGIIHRDLKPDNIFLTRRDGGKLTVTVVDFGIAKLRESATHTLTGTVLGTPAYMSYEQASGMKSDELDARSDIYSLGVVVYEMLTGRVPFQSDTPVGYLRKHLQDAPPPFRAVRPDLPTLPEVEKVVMKALAKDRERRYASVLEFTGEFVRAVSALALTGELRPTVKVVEPLAAREPEQEGPPMKRTEVLRRKEENAEAEVPSARPSPPEPRPKRTLVTPPPSTPPVGTVPKEKTSRLGMAIFAATVLVAILATVTWRYWGGSAQLPGTPQQRTSAPAQPQTPALAPVVDNPPSLPPTPPSGATQILVRTSPDAQV